MIRSLDHIVIHVQELQQAIADYTALGFTVMPGGDHPGGATHNALIIFADGIYLELIAFKRPAPEHVWWQKAQRGGEGFLDYALLPTAIAQDVVAARERGLALEGPFDGGRLRPDGVKVDWQTARSSTSDLPFLCGDITPRELRVPTGDVRHHANDVTGIASLTVAVIDLTASVARYQALLGGAVATSDVGVTVSTRSGIASAIVVLGDTLIRLIALEDTGEATSGEVGARLRDYLATHGQGPFSVALRVSHGATSRMLDLSLSHGAQLECMAADRG